MRLPLISEQGRVPSIMNDAGLCQTIDTMPFQHPHSNRVSVTVLRGGAQDRRPFCKRGKIGSWERTPEWKRLSRVILARGISYFTLPGDLTPSGCANSYDARLGKGQND
jgi:hypothetical protein